MYIFFKATVIATMKGPRVDFLPSTGLHEEPELCYQPLAPICLLRECKRIWVSLSWFSNFPYWLRFCFIWWWSRLPAPSQQERHWGQGSQVKHPGYTHSWSIYWVGFSWKILRNSHPVKRYCMEDRLKDAEGITHPVERYWGGGAQLGKHRETPRAQRKDAEFSPLQGTERSWLSG